MARYVGREAAWRRKWNRDRYVRARQMLVDSMGGKCVQCGSTDDLEFDHIDPKTKSFTILSHWKSSLDELGPELAKCQLLCKSDHLAKTLAEKQPWRHGTIHGYQNRKCRCGPCTAAQRTYMAAYRAKRRAMAPL